MRVEVRATNIELTDGTRRAGERVVLFALNRFAPRLRAVTVVLSDVNGPRGGIDTSCRIRVLGCDGWTITITDIDRSPTHAVTCAANRAARAVGRHLERLRRFDRRPANRARAS